MFQCTVNGNTLPVKEWYFAASVGNSYIKFIDSSYTSVDKTFKDNMIITNIKITDTTQPDYIENYDVYLTRKSITVSNETINEMSEEDNSQNIKQVTKQIITLYLDAPTTDVQVNNIADFVGYIPNPDSLSVEDYKKYTINKSKLELADYLLQHPLQSNVHGDTSKYYAITENKQILLLMELACAQQAKEADILYQPSWNASGEACTYDWTIEELKTLAFQINQVVKPLISYQQAIEETIIGKTSIDEIKLIEIDFDAHDPRNADSSESEEAS